MSIEFAVWLVVGVVFLWWWARWVGAIIRRSLGYRKFRGTWYSADQYAVLMELIDEDRQRGSMVGREEMSALKAWRQGYVDL